MSNDENRKPNQSFSRRDLLGGFAATASTIAMATGIAEETADAQQGCVSSTNCQPAVGQELINPGELKRGTDGFLRGVVTVEAEIRNVSYYAGKNFFCKTHQLRTYHGYTDLNALRQGKTVTLKGVASPGPTLRAQVGDTVQLLFLNRIDTTCFPDTPLTGEGAGCEVAHNATGQEIYPTSQLTIAGKQVTVTDKYPDCFRVSNTTNIHFPRHATPRLQASGTTCSWACSPTARFPLRMRRKQCDDLFKLCTPTDSDPSRWQQNSKEKWDKFQAWYQTREPDARKNGDGRVGRCHGQHAFDDRRRMASILAGLLSLLLPAA